MSHHLESPSSREDGRVDITDMFIFPGEQPDTTVLIMNVNPDAGLSSPTTFRPDALYEFKIDTDGDAIENIGLRLRFGELDPDETQTVELLRVTYGAELDEVAEESLTSGRTAQVISVGNGGRLWAGLAADPFFADGHALEVFQTAFFQNNQLDVTEFGKKIFPFGPGRNVTSIVLELPNQQIPASSIGVFSATYIWKDGERIQINRYGKPLIHVGLLRVDDHLVEHYNRSHPKDDLQLHASYISDVVGRITALANSVSNPQAYGEQVAGLLLPDLMPYQIGTAANYGFAGFNGRNFVDDVFDVTMSLITNTSVSDGISAGGRHSNTFPYVPAAHTAQELQGLPAYFPRS